MTDSTHDDSRPQAGTGTDAEHDTDWAAALAEQAAAGPVTQAQGLTTASSDTGADADPSGTPDDMTDDWAAALAEQTAGETKSRDRDTGADPARTSSPAPQDPRTADLFPPLSDGDVEGASEIDMVMDIPVQLSVELGRTRLTIKNILQLGQGSVVELDGLAGEPMDIYVNGYLIAQGEVVVVDDKYGIRVTDIITPADRINRLNRR